MKKFIPKIVLITGASSGIGKASAQQFAALGCELILISRQKEMLLAQKAEIESLYSTSVLTLPLDVQNPKSVETALMGLPEKWRSIDVLLNSAGLSRRLDKIQDAQESDWDAMIDTNIKGLLYMTKAVLKYMLAFNKGHIINLGSLAGHQVYPGGTVYCATKFAERAISEGIKMEVHTTPIRVTSIQPGAVETGFSLTRFDQDAARAKAVYAGFQPLMAEDVADTIVYCATRPLHVNIREIKVYPTAQTAIQMIHRQS